MLHVERSQHPDPASLVVLIEPHSGNVLEGPRVVLCLRNQKHRLGKMWGVDVAHGAIAHVGMYLICSVGI
jgi:hypothetical protein